jgi:formylglycine-generating enzyme required for sulfatase activity
LSHEYNCCARTGARFTQEQEDIRSGKLGGIPDDMIKEVMGFLDIRGFSNVSSLNHFFCKNAKNVKAFKIHQFLGKFVSLADGVGSKSTFLMGQPSVIPELERSVGVPVQHQVTLSHFKMAEAPVTRGMYKAVMGRNPDFPLWADDHVRYPDVSNIIDQWDKYPDYPVTFVSAADADIFVKKLNHITHENYDLPTEAELEYAIRGKNADGTIIDTTYPWGNELTAGQVADYNASYRKSYNRPVKSSSSNSLGLYDMNGVIWQWSKSNNVNYPVGPVVNPQGEGDPDFRGYRGGQSNQRSDILQCAVRKFESIYYQQPNIGFRLVKRDN